MSSNFAIHEGFTAEEAALLESIIKADALTDAHLAGLQTLLERKGDAVLDLPQLRQFRKACERMRELLSRCDKSPIARAQASR